MSSTAAAHSGVVDVIRSNNTYRKSGEIMTVIEKGDQATTEASRGYHSVVIWAERNSQGGLGSAESVKLQDKSTHIHSLAVLGEGSRAKPHDPIRVFCTGWQKTHDAFNMGSEGDVPKKPRKI